MKEDVTFETPVGAKKWHQKKSMKIIDSNVVKTVICTFQMNDGTTKEKTKVVSRELDIIFGRKSSRPLINLNDEDGDISPKKRNDIHISEKAKL